MNRPIHKNRREVRVGVLVRIALLMVGLLLGGSSCASSAGGEQSTASAPDTSLEDALTQAANDPEVSAEQLRVLEEARDAGSMSYTDVDTAVEATFQCFEDAGVPYSRDADIDVAPGLRAPGYSYTGPEEVADACMRTHSHYAEMAYQTQPAAQELLDQALEAERDTVIVCLRDNGMSVDDDATLDEIRQASIDLFVTTAETQEEPVSCSDNI